MLEKLTDIIAPRFNCDKSIINGETRIFEDLGADSLDLVEILMAVEDTFAVSIPDEEMPNFKTVTDIISYVEANS